MLDVVKYLKGTTVEARPYQIRLVERAFTLFQEKKLRSVLVESPTGSGKTVMALLLAKILSKKLKLRIGWVAMRRYLLQQAEKENREKGFNIPLTFISMFEKDPPKDLDVLIVDEAQHDVTASMGHIHAAVQPKHILGLSSTPYRVDRVKLCFDSVLKDAGIPTLIADGYLSQFEHYTIPTWSPEAVALQYISDVERWGKSIMYFHRLAQCAEAKEKLERAGISCDVVTGSSDVEQQLENFANGKLQVMLNCMKLTEGLDVVDLKTVFCRPACKPVTIQMAGRVLRKHPDLPVKQIVQTAGTPYPFPRLALPSLQHVLIDGTWRTLEVNKDIDTINHRCIHALAHIEVAMPEFIKKAQKTTPRWGGRRRGQRPQ